MLLKDWDNTFNTFSRLSQSDQVNITRLVNMPEWLSMENYYNNILLRKYKDIINEGDLNAAKHVISFIRSLKNNPKALKIAHEKFDNKINEQGTVFSEELKQTGEEFI